MAIGSKAETATLGSGGMQTHAQLPAGQQSGVACLPLPGMGLGGVCECPAPIVMPAARSWQAECTEGLIVPTAMRSDDC